MPPNLSVERTGRSGPLLVAVAITAVTSLVLAGLGFSALLQQHGRFSVGVGVALLLYGLMVGLVAWLGWRKQPLAYGPLVALSVLHGMVIASTANGSSVWWLWLGLIPVAAAVVCLLLPVVRTEFGRSKLDQIGSG